MYYSDEDTIAAIATPPGVGAISVLRVSGSKSIESVDKIFKGNISLSEVPTHTIHYGKILEEGGVPVDDVLVSVFKNPNSYTGEDSVEISTHGNPYICQKILELLISQDTRLAEPGEFTKRAFLNGKMDLAQAEAVADVINSRTRTSLRGARNQLDGLLSGKVKELRTMLINASALIELELDFVEEDINFVSTGELSSKINSVIDEINKLIATYSFGKVLRDGVNVVIAGKPNVGKSSLLNYLLKESRAIVSHIPGTTRDIIREEISIDGILFKLFDTAGVRLTDDFLEKEGVLRSRQAVKEADVVIFINDVISGFAVDLYNTLLELTDEERIIKVVNKIDLSHDPSIKGDVFISALSGEGIEKLLENLKKMALGTDAYSEKTVVVSNLRHYSALNEAKGYLMNAQNSIIDKFTGEFISVDLRNAENCLGEIIGDVSPDDILNNIFSNFCIGK